MPEGPSIVILKDEVAQFTGKRITAVSGNTRLDTARLEGKTVLSFKTWGKHFLVCLEGFTVKIHLLMFGTYRVNSQKDAEPRLHLAFENGELNFYTCSVKFLEGPPERHYDWSADVMNPLWDPRKARQKLAEIPNTMICDALLEQDIFSGVGNIIKNEVLYRTHVHPESLMGSIPPQKLREVIDQASLYSFDFLKWKRNHELKAHWLAHTRKICPRCELQFVKKHTGTKKRRSFFCPNCQKHYL